MSTNPKVQLLNQVSEVDILRFYIPDYEPGKKKNYRSPLGESADDHPSLSFYEKDGKLRYKSHNSGHQGDVFQFVADLKKLDCKTNFDQVLDAIRTDLKVVATKASKQNVRISYSKQPDQLHRYFKTFGVDVETLTRYNVRQVKFHEFVTAQGKRCKFDYNALGRLAVGYAIDGRVKVYFPEIPDQQKKDFGFKDQTTGDVFGVEQLPERSEFIIIAAGEKDCLSLNARQIDAVAFQSENTIPNAKQISELNKRADSVFICYDNDAAGRKAAAKLSALTSWNVIGLPEAFKDVADFFTVKAKSDFLEIMAKAVPTAAPVATPGDAAPVVTPGHDADQAGTTIFHMTEDYLSKRYEFRYNSVSLEIEFTVKGKAEYKSVNENSLYVELNKAGIRVELGKLLAILKSEYVPNFDPIKSYFETLPKWDGEDHIGLLGAHLHAEQPTQLERQFRKWLVRAVKCALIPQYFNKQAFILVHSEQNSGKTTFCRFLCPPALSNYIAENISDDKDSRIALVKNFIINLDELSSLAKHEINSLKSLFSKDCINERLPYDRKNSILSRICNFIGSTNMAEFLTDETGSVRWLCFQIHKIDWGYRERIDINQVWAQAYALHLSGFDCDMTPGDISENETRNAQFQQLSAEAEIIPQYLRAAQPGDPDAVFLNATQVLEYINAFTGLKLSKVMIGRAMPGCGMDRAKNHQTDRYGYWCVKLR